MVLIFAKILSVFAITLVGYGANKFKWLPGDSTKYLSALLLNIATPCLVIYSMSQQELNEDTVSSVIQVLWFFLLALFASTFIAWVAVKIMKAPLPDRGVYQVLMVLTNNGFMGFPLALAVFGEKGLFLMIIGNAMFNVFMYSVGVLMVISGRDEKLSPMTAVKSLRSMPVFGCVAGLIIFAFGIQLPPMLLEFLDTVGTITIPLSMIVIGIQLAESKVMDLLRNRYLFITLILRLVVFPVILFLIFMWLPINRFVFVITIFAMCMPSAAVAAVLADIYGDNGKLGAQGVFLTTLFSLITIPIFAALLHLYLGA